ncbi:MAG: glycoside hydrolase family 2 protein [Nonlabens sp.]|nr:glycoside hydrolase family 2 protein [Nonlabens sp.]
MLMNLRFTLLIALLFMISTSCTSQDPNEKIEKLALDTSWTLKQINGNRDVASNLSAPTTVQSDLFNLGEIPDPFIASNVEDIAWISNESWQYYTNFQLTEEQRGREFISLNLEGLNTYATVNLNGTDILQNDNAFVASRINIKELVNENNILLITFLPTTPFEERANQEHPYTLPLVNSDRNDRVFTRKPQFEYGWDWGPVMNTMGITAPVYVEFYNDFKINDVYLEQTSLTDKLATLTAQIELKEPVTFETMTFELYVNENLSAAVTYEGSGTHAQHFELPFEIKEPQRWWPHNLGNPYLYDVKILARKDGVLVDQHIMRKGLRTVELVNEKDSLGESFIIKINGQPVYAKGANYIPQNSMSNRVKDADYERLLNDVVAANMNFVRVWGGGAYERDLFYELCDKKGLMVWQDFMFACAMYPGDARFRESVKNEATQQVKRLRNHASIALFNGNNEINEAWHNWGWQQGRNDREKEYIWSEYQAIFNGVLPIAVAQHSDLPYWESSPKYGRGDERFKTHGNAHDWWVWHSEYPFEHFEEVVPRFSSEFGFQSHPSYEAVRYINNNGTVDIESDAYASHQKHPRGNALIKEYMGRDFPVPEGSEDYVYVSQLLQSYGISKAMIAQRAARPRSMGTIYWQLNDCWPVVSWSSIDYLGNWKALHYQAARDFSNVVATTKKVNNTLQTTILNDHLVAISGGLRIELKKFDGTTVYDNTQQVTIKPASSELLLITNLDGVQYDLENHYVVTTFYASKRIEFLTNPKSLKLPSEQLTTVVTAKPGGYEITLRAATFQKDVFLYTDVAGHFEDNFINIEKGETRTVFFKTMSKTAPIISFKTLNRLR